MNRKTKTLARQRNSLNLINVLECDKDKKNNEQNKGIRSNNKGGTQWKI